MIITETGQAALPGQDYMYPFGVIGVVPRYIPAVDKEICRSFLCRGVCFKVTGPTPESLTELPQRRGVRHWQKGGLPGPPGPPVVPVPESLAAQAAYHLR